MALYQTSRRNELTTKTGAYRKRNHVRAMFKSVAFLLVVGYYGFFYVEKPTMSTTTTTNNGEWTTTHRHLREVTVLSSSQQEEEEEQILQQQDEQEQLLQLQQDNRFLIQKCSDIEKADPTWFIVWYIVGVLYMFLGLAIVCDEFFVPALEEMSGERRLNLSMDVAGATLMAAGGSAPELFTSLIGTFQESEVGIGTIVGSAVFNVLFVIAMCALMTKEALSLTWWPLFRDSSYYAVGLLVLAMFIGVISKNQIKLWEAIVLFSMYLGYILLMAYNKDLYMMFTGKELVYPEDEDEEDKPTGDASPTLVPPPHFRWQGTFRAGILKLLREGPDSWMEEGGVGMVAKITGDVDHTFKEVDLNGDGYIDLNELKTLFEKLEIEISDEDLKQVFDTLDADNNGKICKEEFESWYVASEERILSQVKHVFDTFDTDNSNTIDKDELKALLVDLEPEISDDDIEQAMQVMYKHGDPNEITYEEFEEWYKSTMLFEKRKIEAEVESSGVWQNLVPPRGKGVFTWIKYLIYLPLVALMTFTIPDVTRPGWERWCYVSFICSIAHIGGYSYLMVWWAEVIGNTIGIPQVVMGYTLLAAGTSVPDLLSSVIVARRGSGDMAISSSIGSNIFDILVGLPIPWILYTAIPSKPSFVYIGSDNIWIMIMTLLGMLVFVIGVIHYQGWKLTKRVGIMMLMFYVGFLVLAILLELPFQTCVGEPKF